MSELIEIPEYLIEDCPKCPSHNLIENNMVEVSDSENLIEIPQFLTQSSLSNFSLLADCGNCQCWCMDCQGATCESVCQGCMEPCMGYCQNSCEGNDQRCYSCMSSCQNGQACGSGQCSGASCMASCQCSCEGTCQETCLTCQCGTQNNQCGSCQTSCQCSVQNNQCDSCQTTCQCLGQSNQCGSCQGGGQTVPVIGFSGSPQELNLIIGNTGIITISIVPSNATNKNITWSSSNTNVATVAKGGVYTNYQEGIVTAKGVGECIITATSQDNPSIKYNAYVYVSTGTTPVTSVLVTPDIAEIYVGETKQFVASIYPTNATNTKVTWSSSNASVATINSNGLATGISNGTVTITCRTEDGGFIDTSTLTITTYNPYVPVTNVSITPTDADIEAGNTYQFNYSIAPNNATDPSVTWSSNNTSIATVSSSGLVTAIAQGTCSITVRSTSSGLTSSATVRVAPKLTAWNWSYNIISGGNVYNTVKVNDTTVWAYIIPATEWNDFTGKINILRRKKGKTDYPFSNVSKDSNLTKNIVDDAINALNQIGGNMSFLSDNKIYAQTFIDLKNTFNTILATI